MTDSSAPGTPRTRPARPPAAPRSPSRRNSVTHPRTGFDGQAKQLYRHPWLWTPLLSQLISQLDFDSVHRRPSNQTVINNFRAWLPTPPSLPTRTAMTQSPPDDSNLHHQDARIGPARRRFIGRSSTGLVGIATATSLSAVPARANPNAGAGVGIRGDPPSVGDQDELFRQRSYRVRTELAREASELSIPAHPTNGGTLPEQDRFGLPRPSAQLARRGRSRGLAPRRPGVSLARAGRLREDPPRRYPQATESGGYASGQSRGLQRFTVRTAPGPRTRQCRESQRSDRDLLGLAAARCSLSASSTATPRIGT